ncbi:MAG: manganese ABC transporter permease [Phycisphaeraceae bacterium]|nr:MAG: manganese ABC transporter permease [Phycisphaeraceae bacterium]
MSDAMAMFLRADLLPIVAALSAALSCALLGNFLVLRRESMLGDAISHAVLPGIVAGFLMTGSRAGLPMLLGAGAAGITAVVLVELVRRLGRVEPGAAMGVVFSVMFALGVVLMEQAAADHVDLDAGCVLYGQLESLSWWLPDDLLAAPLSSEALDLVPSEIWLLLSTLVVVVVFVLVMFKELRLASFDRQLATSLGFRPRLVSYALAIMVALVTVASFKAVGSILVVAMLVCPPAAARMLTDRLETQVILSAVIGTAVALSAYALGAWGAPAVGLSGSVNIAGMMATVGGGALALAVVASPTHGVIARARRRRSLAARVGIEDLVGSLYRSEELGSDAVAPEVLASLLGGQARAARSVQRGLAQGLVERSEGGIRLTDAGRTRGAATIRSHRLWETYLVEEVGLRPDHVHVPAETLEHVRADSGRPIGPSSSVSVDPHGHPIPGGEGNGE